MSDKIEQNEKYLRQTEIADPEKFKLPVTILGLGAAGSTIALGAAKLGCPDLRLIDFDKIEVHNAANQFCMVKSQSSKVSDMSALIKLTSHCENIKLFPYKLVGKGWGQIDVIPPPIIPTPREIIKGILINCPDDMQARKDFWYLAKYNPDCHKLIDVRMAGQYFIIYVVSPMSTKDVSFYESTLHSNEESSPELCGARGIIYTSFMVGGFVTNLIKKIQLGESTPSIIEYDAHLMTLSVKINNQVASNKEAMAMILVN